MKSALVLGLSLIATTPFPAVPAAVDAITASTLDAMGGRERLRDLRNVRIAAAWTENGTHFTGDYRATREGHMRIDVFIDGKRVYSEGLDRNGAWEQGSDGKVVSVGAAAQDALAHGIAYRFDGIWFARERGHRVTYDGTARADGRDYHVVKLTFLDGFETYFLINPQTWLPERQRDTRAYHPTSDPQKIAIETAHSDFRPHCGVAMPHESRDLKLETGEVLTERKVTRIDCNVAADALEVARPR